MIHHLFSFTSTRMSTHYDILSDPGERRISFFRLSVRKKSEILPFAPLEGRLASLLRLVLEHGEGMTNCSNSIS